LNEKETIETQVKCPYCGYLNVVLVKRPTIVCKGCLRLIPVKEASK